MASSSFYPIIYACFVHGYSQMDIEAGATRYAVTVLVYLSAVTIYGVSRLERNTYPKTTRLTSSSDKDTRSVATRTV